MNYCLAIKYNSKYSCKKSPNRSTPQRHRRKTYKGVTHSNNYGSSPLYTTARQIDQVNISHIDHVPWYVTIDRYIALTYVSYVNVVATFERQRQTNTMYTTQPSSTSFFMSNINYDIIQSEYKNNSFKLFDECKHHSYFHPEIPQLHPLLRFCFLASTKWQQSRHITVTSKHSLGVYVYVIYV